MTDNAFCYRRSRDFAEALGRLEAWHLLIRPHCPWQNGKVERLNRTLQREWVYFQVFTSNAERTNGPARMAHLLQHPASPLGARWPSPDQPAVTNAVSEYT